MAIKDWTTDYPTGQDVIATVQPDLVDNEDNTRVAQLHALRDKLQAACVEIGTIPGNEPGGCLRARVAALEAAGGGASDRWLIYKQDTEYSEPGISFVDKFSFRVARNPDKLNVGWVAAVGQWATGSYGGRAETRITVASGSGSDQWTVYSDLSAVEVVYFADKAVTEGVMPASEAFTVTVALRCDTSGDDAYMKFFEFFYVLESEGGGGG